MGGRKGVGRGNQPHTSDLCMLKCVFNELGKIANKMCVRVLVCVRGKNRKNFGYCVQLSGGVERVVAWLCVRSTEIIVSHKFCVLRLNLILVGQPQCQLKRPTSQSPSINFSLVLFFGFSIFFCYFLFSHCIRFLFRGR